MMLRYAFIIILTAVSALVSAQQLQPVNPAYNTEVTFGQSVEYMCTGSFSGVNFNWVGNGTAYSFVSQQGDPNTGSLRAIIRFDRVTGSVVVSCCGSSQCPSHTMLVRPAPPINVTHTKVCKNSASDVVATVQASPLGTGGNQIRWYRNAFGGDIIGTGTSITAAIPVTVTVYAASYSPFSGESLTRTPVTATVVTPITTAPTVTGNAIIGPNRPLALVAQGAGQGMGYAWFKTDPAAIIETSYVYNTTAPAQTTTNFMAVRLTSAPGCEGPITNVNVTVYPFPVIQGSGIIQGGEQTLSCNADYDTYAWYNVANPSVILKTGTSQADNKFLVTVPGTYRVRVTKGTLTATSDPFQVKSQFEGQNQNYIVTNNIQVGGVTDPNAVPSLSKEGNAQSVAYFDGLGRPMQNVSTQGSPLGFDVVQPVTYDKFGREERQYLPIVMGTKDGWYKLSIVDANGYTGAAATNVYNNGLSDKVADDTKPYAVTTFEPSPLNRVLLQGASGNAWQPNASSTYANPVASDHSIKKAYEVNAANEVLRWTYTLPSSTYPLGLVNTGTGTTPVYYGANQLKRYRTKDEHQNEVIEYIDKEGHTVLKRVQASSGSFSLTDAGKDVNYASTYYIYDDFANVICVIPPEATSRLSTEYHHPTATDATKDTFLSRWAFRYTYDKRQRLTQKQLPGVAPVYMVYDSRDRLVLTQDGNQRSKRQWVFTKYDGFNRVIMTGIIKWKSNRDHAGIQDDVTNFYATASAWGENYVGAVANNVHGYSNTSFPMSDTLQNYLTITYYDDYRFKTLFNAGIFTYKNDELLAEPQNTAQESSANELVKGHVTGSKARMLTAASWLKTVNYYDKKYRLIQQISENVKGHTVTTNTYDFASKIKRTKSSLYAGQPVVWKEQVNVTIANDVVSATDGAWGAGAASIQVLPANTDGWVEFTVLSIDPAKRVSVGFSAQNTNPNYTSINYAIFVNGATLSRNQSGGLASLGEYVYPGDVLRVERVGTTIYFKRNGNIIGQTPSTVVSTEALMADMSLQSAGAKFSRVRLSGAFGQPTEATSYFTKRFSYDHGGRLVDTWHTIGDGSEILLSHNAYNELGQLVSKDLHKGPGNATFAQSLDYRYNIRGWLTSLNNAELAQDNANDDLNDFFGMNLGYNETPGGVSTLPPSLVSWYKLDGNGQEAGNSALNGTVTGASATADGHGNAGKAMSFNGATQYVQIAGSEEQHAFIQNTGRFTITAFIKLNSLTARSFIISSGGASGLKSFNFMYETAGSGYGNHQLRYNPLAGGAASSSQMALGNQNTINDTNWHHVAVVGDGKTVRFYVDGVADGSPTTITLYSTGAATRPTLIGATYNSPTNAPVVGAQANIDEVMIFNEPLSVSEIQKLIARQPVESFREPGQYNGNISTIRWSKNQGLGDVKQTLYRYGYDPMNRITGTVFQEKGAVGWSSLPTGGFNESGITYDLNGNIKTLNRYDGRTAGIMDRLVYNYGASGGNRLMDVADYGDVVKGFSEGNLSPSVEDYTYDANGNMLRDINKAIATNILYNYLNLPEKIEKHPNSIGYAYDAAGVKHAQTVFAFEQQTTTEYAGPWIFENNRLQFLQHDEGRIVLSKNTLVYKNTADGVDNVVASPDASLSNETINGETYIKITEAAGSITKTGLADIGGRFAVNEGERYLYRLKGYWPTTAHYLYVGGASTPGGALTDILWRGSALQKAAVQEAWAENLVVVPPGITELSFGVYCYGTNSTVTATYVNDVEIYKLEEGIPEYQYNLKDHLGDVRVTFTTKPETKQYVAGFETANQNSEAADFDNYPSGGGQINNIPANARTGTSSHLLNGGYAGQVGVAKSFSVMPGDQVQIEAYAKYSTPSENPTDYNFFVPALLAAFNLSAPMPGEVGTASSAISDFGAWEIGANGNASDDDPIKAFVSIVLFDRNHNFLDVAYIASTGPGALISQSYIVKEPGYAYLYVSNEQPTQLNVYFDDVTISHTMSPVIQMDDYYPFGLTFNSYQRESSMFNNYLYNSKERQDALALGWFDYGARMYMPEIGRWGVVDPLADLMRRHSPYNYAFDNPINHVDPDGRNPFPIIIKLIQTINFTLTATRVAIGYKIWRTESKLENVHEDISDTRSEINQLMNPQAGDDVAGDSGGSGDFYGAGSTTQWEWDTPETGDRVNAELKSDSERFKEKNPDKAKQLTKLEKKIEDLKGKETNLSKKLEALERSKEAVDEIDPKKQTSELLAKPVVDYVNDQGKKLEEENTKKQMQKKE